MEYIVEMRGIRKEFPGVLANDDISIALRQGEVLALLGENGAGKSTLMSILFGLYQPDAGTILVREKEVVINNPNIANELCIGMVHQHFKLVHNFSITQNIILGIEPRKGPVLSIKAASQRVRDLSEKYGLNVDPDAKIEDVSVGMQQRVEILKMLYRNAEVLIFDEPTGVLTPQEIVELMNIIHNLIAEGKSIILITHKLKEIKAIADRCTVIRRGKVVGTVQVSETSEAQMAEMMVGRQVNFVVEKAERIPGDVLLRIDNLSVRSTRKHMALRDFNLEVRSGEIVGVAGVEGNGQSELVEAITGLRRAEAGKVFLKGKDITSIPVRARTRNGMAHIPEDRQKRGLILDYTLEENLVMKLYDHPPFSRRGFLNKPAIREHADRLLEKFDVRSGNGALSLVRTLSGGNQQKAIVGREIDLDPDVLIAVQPTRGLDVGSIEYIHKRLVEQRDRGKAVLLVSLELDEILSLSDRIAVVCRGELVGVLDARDANEQQVGLLMAGIKKGDAT